MHLPTHASWLNQIEIFFSIPVRKALQPADFESQEALRERLENFVHYYNREARPFAWSYTPEKPKAYLTRLAEKSGEYAEQLARLGRTVDGQPRPPEPSAAVGALLLPPGSFPASLASA